MPAKKRVAKKVTKSRVKSSVEETVMMPTPVTVPEERQPTRRPMNKRVLWVALIVVAIAATTYKFGPWLVPAIVDGRPITRFALWSRLEQSYGQQALDDMQNEAILDRAIAKAGVTVEQKAVDAQMDSLNKQFESLGGLDEALKQRGLTRTELEKQVRTQLSVEKILSDQVTVSDEEIKKEYDSNATTLYKDQKFDDVKGNIATSLKDSKLKDAFLTWFAKVKEETKVKNFGL